MRTQLFTLALLTLSLMTGHVHSSSTRLERMDEISYHAQSFVPAASSSSESAREVKARGKKWVLDSMNLRCEEMGGAIVDKAWLKIKSVSDSTYRSQAIYHSYLITLPWADCLVDIKKEAELKNKRIKEEKEEAIERAIEHQRQLENERKRIEQELKDEIENLNLLKSWYAKINTERDICDYMASNKLWTSYLSTCLDRAREVNLTSKAAKLTFIATFFNVAAADQFMIELNNKDIEDNMVEVLAFTTLSNYEYGFDLLKIVQGNQYKNEDIQDCFLLIKSNIGYSSSCFEKLNKN